MVQILAVMAIDVSGHLTYVNRFAETLTGRSRDDLLGTPLSSMFQQHHHPPTPGVCGLSRQAMEESRRFGPAYDWVQTNHDTCHPVTECYAAPIYNRYGLISGAMIVVGAIVNAVRSFRDIESRGDSLTRDGPGDARASRSTDWYGGAQTEAAAMPTVGHAIQSATTGGESPVGVTAGS
jgi:PAS domain S-box-containing protein